MSRLPDVPFRNALTRRAITVPAVAFGAVALGSTVGIWAPVAAALDLATARSRLPRLRLLTFAAAWTTLETIGVGAAASLWLAGRPEDRDAHYALQRWWAARLVDSLRVIGNLRIEAEGIDALTPGPIVMCARHSSVADSLLPAWLLGQVDMRPRYVLKDDLLLDPCLDIVGNRLPNHFVDRTPDTAATELRQLEELATGMTNRDAAVIFPEGMVVTDARRSRALQRVEDRDPSRAERLRSLRLLAPARPGGTAALLLGAPTADLVFVTHVGLESVREIGDAIRNIPLRAPLRVKIRRVKRRNVPTGDAFPAWLDREWAIADRDVAELTAGREA